jgi:hypothetical protein
LEKECEIDIDEFNIEKMKKESWKKR